MSSSSAQALVSSTPYSALPYTLNESQWQNVLSNQSQTRRAQRLSTLFAEVLQKSGNFLVSNQLPLGIHWPKDRDMLTLHLKGRDGKAPENGIHFIEWSGTKWVIDKIQQATQFQHDLSALIASYLPMEPQAKRAYQIRLSQDDSRILPCVPPNPNLHDVLKALSPDRTAEDLPVMIRNVLVLIPYRPPSRPSLTITAQPHPVVEYRLACYGQIHDPTRTRVSPSSQVRTFQICTYNYQAMNWSDGVGTATSHLAIWSAPNSHSTPVNFSTLRSTTAAPALPKKENIVELIQLHLVQILAPVEASNDKKAIQTGHTMIRGLNQVLQKVFHLPAPASASASAIAPVAAAALEDHFSQSLNLTN